MTSPSVNCGAIDVLHLRDSLGFAILSDIIKWTNSVSNGNKTVLTTQAQRSDALGRRKQWTNAAITQLSHTTKQWIPNVDSETKYFRTKQQHHALRFKEKGNEFLRKGDLVEAITQYSAGLLCARENTIRCDVFSNRSFVLLRMHREGRCGKHSDNSSNIEKSNKKYDKECDNDNQNNNNCPHDNMKNRDSNNDYDDNNRSGNDNENDNDNDNGNNNNTNNQNINNNNDTNNNKDGNRNNNSNGSIDVHSNNDNSNNNNNSNSNRFYALIALHDAVEAVRALPSRAKAWQRLNESASELLHAVNTDEEVDTLTKLGSLAHLAKRTDAFCNRGKYAEQLVKLFGKVVWVPHTTSTQTAPTSAQTAPHAISTQSTPHIIHAQTIPYIHPEIRVATSETKSMQTISAQRTRTGLDPLQVQRDDDVLGKFWVSDSDIAVGTVLIDEPAMVCIDALLHPSKEAKLKVTCCDICGIDPLNNLPCALGCHQCTLSFCCTEHFRSALHINKCKVQSIVSQLRIDESVLTGVLLHATSNNDATAGDNKIQASHQSAELCATWDTVSDPMDLFERVAIVAALVVYLETRHQVRWCDPTSLLEDIRRVQVNAFGIRHRRVTQAPSGNYKNVVEDPASSYGVFPLASKANHSCSPNAMVRFPTSRSVTLYTIKPIKAGDVICISYGPHVREQALAQRQFMLSQTHGFVCGCEACVGGGLAESVKSTATVKQVPGCSNKAILSSERERLRDLINVCRTSFNSLNQVTAGIKLTILREYFEATNGVLRAYGEHDLGALPHLLRMLHVAKSAGDVKQMRACIAAAVLIDDVHQVPMLYDYLTSITI